MHLSILSGIILIVLIVDFALAAPVLVQEKRQACVDVADIPKFSVTLSEKQGRMWDENIEGWVAFLKKPSGLELTELGHSAPTPDPAPSREFDYNAPAPNPAPSTDPHHNAPAPNPGPSTESEHPLAGMHAPLSSPVYSTWFHPDNELLGAHASRPNTGPSNPSSELDSDNRLVAEEPPSPTKGSSTEFSIEMTLMPPSSRRL